MPDDVLAPESATDELNLPAGGHQDLEGQRPPEGAENAPEQPEDGQQQGNDQDEQQQKRKGPTLDERIAKLKQQTAIMRQQERRLQEQQAQLQQQREQMQSQQFQAPEPDPDDYPDVESYREVWKKWYKASQEAQRPQQVREEIRKAQEQQLAAQEQMKWEMRRDDALDPDSEAYIPNIGKYIKAVDMTFNIHDTHPAIERGIKTSKNPIEMIAYLGKNLDELEELAQANPMQGLMKLGAIQSKLGKAPAKPKSQPPAPMGLMPAAGGGGAVPTNDISKLAKMPWNEYVALQRKRETGR